MKEVVLKYVLKNAFEFKGSVNTKVVLGMILRDNPDLKKDVPKVLSQIEKITKEVAKKSLKDIEIQLYKINPELLETKKKEIKGPLKVLPNAQKGNVVVRIAPSPSGPLHIGHAYGAALNSLYAQMYNGKFILRIEDTNPENIYEKAYDLIEQDAQWLTQGNITKIVVQSSRLKKYHTAAQKLVDSNNAYVCECDANTFREQKNNAKACPCRSLDIKEHQKRYKKMFKRYSSGEAVLRLKTDIKHKNPAMRDFAIMRINEHSHPKTGTKERVWPLMVLSVAIDDHELGITHVLNGKDHADNAHKEAMIIEMLGSKPPIYKHWGMINFEGFSLSSTKTRIAIEQKEYHGWDDIRLPTLPALRRRGYQPGAFEKFAIEIGLSLTDKKVSRSEFWKHINAFNRDIIEPNSNRFFFVENPVEVEMQGAVEKKVEFDVHPDYPKRGKREVMFNGKVLLAQNDIDLLEENKIHRLIDCCNFMIEKGKFNVLSEEYEEFKHAGKKKGNIIHWLPKEHKTIPVEVLLEDGTCVKGIGENGLRDVDIGTIVQFERNYFVRIDSSTQKNITCWYLHT
jgi:glutamyl-tRNA synthetase